MPNNIKKTQNNTCKTFKYVIRKTSRSVKDAKGYQKTLKTLQRHWVCQEKVSPNFHLNQKGKFW